MPDAPESAFSGGANGTWLDSTPVSRFETTDVSGVDLTAYGNKFGRWVDRSGNVRDATTTATDSTRPTATNPVSPNDWRFYAQMLDTTLSIAGVGGTNATGFYCALAGQSTSYYGDLWSDASGNTGFMLQHSSDGNDVVPQYIFSAGTGSARVQARVDAGHTLYQNQPANTPAVIECWWDGTNINIRRNGGTTVSTACSTVSAGTTDVRLNASLAADAKGMALYEFVLTKAHLPSSTVRDDIRAYLTEAITPYRDGAAAIAGVGAVTSAGQLVKDGAAAVVGAAVMTAAGLRLAQGQAAMAGASALTAVGTLYLFGSAAVFGLSNVTTNGTSGPPPVFKDGAAALSSVSVLLANGILVNVQEGAAHIQAVSNVQAIGQGSLWTEAPPAAGAWQQAA